MRKTLFKENLSELFNISRADVLDKKGVLEKGKLFLVSQREEKQVHQLEA